MTTGGAVPEETNVSEVPVQLTVQLRWSTHWSSTSTSTKVRSFSTSSAVSPSRARTTLWNMY